MKELAEGLGALSTEDTSQSRKCIEAFEAGAGEEIYELLKKMTQFYAGSVRQEPGWPGCPEYIVLDDETSWASWVILDILEDESYEGI